ncbi:hypothetical protein FNV43_RR05081 [Rhamnella rubrinervis]|uniref:Uncharacterized protein n=1 Tax=Rhamnella rubrinervis TaxID=2594499 RepID=A0A8K0HN97_9ROSA|nr:hypothetical protein FNV43_RR05081 [Rhamnella rubrinervis]
MKTMQVYIVYMGSLPDDEVYSPMANHISLLQEALQTSSVGNSLVRSYRRSFNGFAARLTDSEKQKLAETEGVVTVFPSRYLKLQTTRSWDFIGLDQKAKRNPTAESDVIVGVIDTGVWPESESFSDEGFGPPPKKWKGACDGGADFKCNNKIIGARFYVSEATVNATARDTIGHGSHTASTAAGNVVNNASFFGLAEGTARGGVPSARIAAYKVCEIQGCSTENILAAFDDAIADGVDIISISIGGDPTDYDQDTIAIGSFHGLNKGVLTVNSAGNSGPSAWSASSLAPWMISVAASSTDRQIVDKVVLGNGQTLVGASVNSFKLNGTSFPLIYGKDVVAGQCSIDEARNCTCINQTAVKGKILICDHFADPEAYVNVIGTIYLKTKALDTAFVEPVPAAGLNRKAYTTVQNYFNSAKNPHGNISISIAITDSAAPKVASFSSRGPNIITPDILKPDITAPGMNILAAYPPVASPSESDVDKRSVKYNLVSGTSMSCPHVAGAAAYVKTFHPDWSPSAIKSSLMTTARVMTSTVSSGGDFGYGAGHIDPVKAIDPGLVYETSRDDYINFLCGIGYGADRVRLISGDKSSCPKVINEPKDLNYPSFSHQVLSNGNSSVQFQRSVKNVGLANSIYKAEVAPNAKLNIKVVPESLSFKSLNELKTFNVTVEVGGLAPGSVLSSSIVWSDGTHSVRSPIVIFR